MAAHGRLITELFERKGRLRDSMTVGALSEVRCLSSDDGQRLFARDPLRSFASLLVEGAMHMSNRIHRNATLDSSKRGCLHLHC